MGYSWDDIHGEANQKSADRRVDRAEEWEDDGQEPYRNHHWKPCQCPQKNAFSVMHPYYFLPHEVQWCASKPKCYELQYPIS